MLVLKNMMSEKNSFDHVATEILFEIFDYLSCNDIIYAFFDFNQRLNSILLAHQRYVNKFETPKTNFRFWNERILPIIKSQIEYLIISNTDFPISLDLFPNLRSLIISSSLPLYYDELVHLWENEQFKKLTTFKIQSAVLERDAFNQPNFFLPMVFNQRNSLKIFESLSELSASSFHQQINNLNSLQSLSIKIPTLHSLFILLEHTPNLKYLNIVLSSLYLNNDLNLSKIQLKKLSCTVENSSIQQGIFHFLNQFSSSLISLSLNLNYINTQLYQFDGLFLEKQLLNSMIQLKYFHLYVKFDEEPNDVKQLLSTFENRFWRNHHWSIGIHKKYLYTLPFHFDQLKDFIDFDCITSKILNPWSHVKSLHLAENANFNSNLLKQLKFQMPNLISIIFNSQFTIELQPNLTLDTVSTVHYQGEYLQNIKQWFIHIFPNAKHLVLSYQPPPSALSTNRMRFVQKLDAYFRGEQLKEDYVYFLNIQSVQIKLILKYLEDLYKHVLRLMREFFEAFQNLQSFTFEIYHVTSNQDSIPHPYTDLTELIQLLNVDKISKKYHIKHIDHYFQFIKKSE